MLQFKTTYNILKKPDEDEAFNQKWFSTDKLSLPPKINWDYKRELKIEDVDLWEVLYEESNGVGVYAAWMPYAEFYIITTGFDFNTPPTVINGFWYYDRIIETYYGSNSNKQVHARCMELRLPVFLNKLWVDDEEMWLHKEPEKEKIILI
jgi:hypothetical protein